MHVVGKEVDACAENSWHVIVKMRKQDGLIQKPFMFCDSLHMNFLPLHVSRFEIWPEVSQSHHLIHNQH